MAAAGKNSDVGPIMMGNIVIGTAQFGDFGIGLRAYGVEVKSIRACWWLPIAARHTVPFQLVLGDREVEAHEVKVRVRGQEKAEGSVPVDAFMERVKRLIEDKSATLED